ncbi:32143_t:CDS:1, partial [Gigaspora margarita]
LPWNDLSFTGAPKTYDASACSGGNNNNLIFIFGDAVNNISFTNKFDLSSQQWTNVTSGGNEPTKRDNFSCAKYNNRFIAIFSGDNNFRIPNDLWIFDSLESTWSLNNASNAPQNIYGYCAITLPDETILYIGGTFRDILKGVPMNK